MPKQFRITANFPVLREHSHQTVIVEGSNWQVALGKAARAFKRLDVMHRRRVTALSMMVEQMETVHESNNHQPELSTSDPPPSATPATEETVMEGPTPEELNQQAEDEAEKLIEEGQEIEDIEET